MLETGRIRAIPARAGSQEAGYGSCFGLPLRGSISVAPYILAAKRDISHSSLQYPMCEYLKFAMSRRSGGGRFPVWQSVCCGTMACVVSAALPRPCEVLKADEPALREAPRGGASEQLPPPGSGSIAGALSRHLAQEVSLSASALAGLSAGITVDVALHPIDTLKTRMQSKEGFARSGGTKGVWNGISAVLLLSVPGSMVFFLVYDQVRHSLERRAPGGRDTGSSALWQDATAACLADIAACVVRVPCEVLKQRMQTCEARGVPASFAETARGIGREGFRGFFAGYGATVCREVPYALIQMPLFEELKLRHPWAAEAQRSGDKRMQGFVSVTCGGLAGMTAASLTTPLDVAKTRIILMEKRSERGNLRDTLVLIRKESGLRGLFRGVVPRTIYCGIGGALWLGSFEISKLFFRDDMGGGRAAA